MTRLQSNNPDWRADPRHAAANSAIRLTAFVTDRWRWVVGVVVGLLAVSVLIAGYIFWSGRKETDSAAALRKAVAGLEAIMQSGSDVAKLDEGLRLLHDVINRYPTTAAAAEATLRLGTHYYTMGRYKEARTAYITYLDKNPRGQIAFSAGLGVGDTLLAEGQYEKAVETYSRLIEQFGEAPLLVEAQLHLATAYLSLNRVKEAGALYEKVVTTHPNSGWAQRAQSGLYKLGLTAR